MTKNTDYHLDLTTATPDALQGYILSAGFNEWLASLDDDDLLTVERAFNNAYMNINTIRDLISYLEGGNAFAEALKLDDDTLELLHSLAKGLHNVAANELAFRRRVKERQP